VEVEGDNPKVQVQSGGETKTFSPEEISGMVLERVKEITEAQLQKPIKDVVLAVPSFFNESQRLATREAAAISGLNVMKLIEEPVAAAIAYGLHKRPKGQNFLIFAMGGATFDLSLLPRMEKVASK
jgi:L1 cell adhesion molecule like protein